MSAQIDESDCDEEYPFSPKFRWVTRGLFILDVATWSAEWEGGRNLPGVMSSTRVTLDRIVPEWADEREIAEQQRTASKNDRQSQAHASESAGQRST